MASAKPTRIRRLPETVVNRIAAGEVVQRPSAALKELIENCLDAGSKSIVVTVNGGGLQLLQIVDDGCGISRKDMKIVCERFTTSKLEQFEDLKNIGTYGFRGEALASISHVAKVSITSMTEGAKCAYRADYRDGKVTTRTSAGKLAPVPCAGVKGTQVVVQDLFYNVPARRRTIRSTSDEHNRILAVVQKYAIQHSATGIAFVCRKLRTTNPDVHCPASTPRQDAIRLIYGSKLANELVPFSCSVAAPAPEPFAPAAGASGAAASGDGRGSLFTAEGLATNANYGAKKAQFILFINQRLVDCAGLRRAVEGAYEEYLPRGSKPFVFLDIRVPPPEVDVNVHPTKREVLLLHEEEIASHLVETLRAALLGANKSRVFYTQQSIQTGILDHVDAGKPSAPSQAEADDGEEEEELDRPTAASKQRRTPAAAMATPSQAPATLNPSRKVRTSFHTGSLETYLVPRASLGASAGAAAAASSAGDNDDNDDDVDEGMAAAVASKFRQHQPTDEQFENWKRTSTLAATAPAGEDDCCPPGQAGAVEVAMSIAEPQLPARKRRQRPTDSDRSDLPPSSQAAASSQAAGGGRGARGRRARKPTFVDVQLTSVQEILSELEEDKHDLLTQAMRQHRFVGVVDSDLSLFQYETKLFLVRHAAFARELFYQQAIRLFANSQPFELEPPVEVPALLRAALADDPEVAGDQQRIDRIAEDMAAMLLSKDAMLSEYFSVSFATKEGDQGGETVVLRTLPRLVDGHVPFMTALPAFLLSLGWDVDWTQEKPCFQDVAAALAAFYSAAPPLPDWANPTRGTGPMAEEAGDTAARQERVEAFRAEPSSLFWIVSNVWFPAMRNGLTPSKALAGSDCITQVACTTQLYRIFERC